MGWYHPLGTTLGGGPSKSYNEWVMYAVVCNPSAMLEVQRSQTHGNPWDKE